MVEGVPLGSPALHALDALHWRYERHKEDSTADVPNDWFSVLLFLGMEAHAPDHEHGAPDRRPRWPRGLAKKRVVPMLVWPEAKLRLLIARIRQHLAFAGFGANHTCRAWTQHEKSQLEGATAACAQELLSQMTNQCSITY